MFPVNTLLYITLVESAIRHSIYSNICICTPAHYTCTLTAQDICTAISWYMTKNKWTESPAGRCAFQQMH